ncbi:porin family protein [Psychroflexus planctonicus]|uniref:Outer membrane protein beta-barrel domain-containing protein n=1 Tax=Psychroflexus planctonicus TaxID=1526575 RepID=A0ABQ1SLQ5_9FLAO|nr:porin family protein [Psychroflexus planctonicus]GGE41727.1 hypothetical protein GCM10010832_22200 [Psychroflexus planctonicus]
MRKSILYIFALISTCSFSQKEDVTEDKIDFGFRFGLSLSDLITSSNSVEPRPTFLAGIHAEYKLNSTWSVQPELLFSRKGEMSRSTDSQSSLRAENRLLLDYIELPILARYRLKNNISFEAGPYVSYLVTAKKEILEGTNFESSNFYDLIEKFDSGLAIGATYQTEWNFFLGFRYSRGFINVSKNASSILEDQYNAQFQMYFGYSF